MNNLQCVLVWADFRGGVDEVRELQPLEVYDVGKGPMRVLVARLAG